MIFSIFIHRAWYRTQFGLETVYIVHKVCTFLHHEKQCTRIHFISVSLWLFACPHFYCIIILFASSFFSISTRLKTDTDISSYSIQIIRDMFWGKKMCVWPDITWHFLKKHVIWWRSSVFYVFATMSLHLVTHIMFDCSKQDKIKFMRKENTIFFTKKINIFGVCKKQYFFKLFSQDHWCSKWYAIFRYRTCLNLKLT